MRRYRDGLSSVDCRLTKPKHFVVKVQERKKYLEKVLLEQTKLSPADIERSRVLVSFRLNPFLVKLSS